MIVASSNRMTWGNFDEKLLFENTWLREADPTKKYK